MHAVQSAATIMPKAAQAVAKKILMCRPTYFQVNYSINPWMTKHSGVNRDKAIGQWNALKSSIEAAGGQVLVMEPDGAAHYPDIVFTANAAVLRGRKVYLSNFACPERQGERYFYKQWFENNGYQTVGGPEEHFEGAGDALWAGKNDSMLFCGVGPRTDVRALDRIGELLDDGTNFKVVGCRLVDPRFYHIDTCFCPISPEAAIWFPSAFDSITQHNMRNELDMIPVTEKEARQFACNAVVIGKTVIMNKDNTQIAKTLRGRGFQVVTEQEATQFACNAVVVGRTVVMHKGNDRIGATLERLGFKMALVAMFEFMKSGGSAKCCTIELPTSV